MNAVTENTNLSAIDMAVDAIANAEAEQGVLSALLLDNGAFDRIGDTLKAEHFFHGQYRAIYAEISRELLAGKAVDMFTVQAGLDGQVTLAELNAIAQFAPSAANIRRWAGIIVERAKSRALMAVSSAVLELAQDHSRSIEDRVDAAQAQLAKLIDDLPRDEWVGAAEGMVAHIELLEARAEGRISAYPTGLRDLDDYLSGGFRPGQLVIVGARPSMGKTALAMTIGLGMAAHYSVAMLSMEMPHTELRDRKVAMLGRVNLSSVQNPKRNNLDWDRVVDGIEKARVLNFIASDQGGLNIQQVRSKARNVKRTHGLDVLIVDYIGLMSGMDSKQPRAYQLEEISRGLKTLAKELDMVVLCLAQVNRRVEERADQSPGLSDLRDSGAIEQDADVVLFVNRPKQAKPDLGPEWDHYAKVTVAKNRNGRCGNLSLFYQGDQTRFDNWAGEAPYTPAAATSNRKGFQP